MHQWVKYGKRFGYPDCCIADFVKRDEGDEFIFPRRIQCRVSKNTGFLPCSYCSWKVMSGQCKLEDLIKDRKERKPFPKT